MLLVNNLLLGLPFKGLMGIFKKIAEMAEAELTDEAKISEELLQLETLFEMDQITEEEYREKEAQLLERLSMAREEEEEN